jgi:hypothetical protein
MKKSEVEQALGVKSTSRCRATGRCRSRSTAECPRWSRRRLGLLARGALDVEGLALQTGQQPAKRKMFAVSR